MADPLTLAIAGIQLIATVGQTISGIRQANQASRDARAEAKSIGIQTEIVQRQERKQNTRILAKQQAITAASGLDPTSGSPLAQTLSSAFEGEMNALNIGFSGELRRQSKLREARFARQQIPGIAFAGLFQGGSILTDMFQKTKQANGSGLGPKTNNFPLLSSARAQTSNFPLLSSARGR